MPISNNASCGAGDHPARTFSRASSVFHSSTCTKPSRAAPAPSPKIAAVNKARVRQLEPIFRQSCRDIFATLKTIVRSAKSEKVA